MYGHHRDLTVLTPSFPTRRSSYRRAQQLHMRPRPRFLALIALEAVERDDERSLRTLRAKAGVDVVALARGGGHRHGGGHALREAVVIGRRAERARPVR